MNDEDYESAKKTRFAIGADLTSYSIEELELLARELGAEIARINGAIKKKKGDLQSAESIFK